MKELFLLDPEVVYLNHGSFGACPRPVFEAYQRYQLELERRPVELLKRRYRNLLDGARERLAPLTESVFGLQEPGASFVLDPAVHGEAALWDKFPQKGPACTLRRSLPRPGSVRRARDRGPNPFLDSRFLHAESASSCRGRIVRRYERADGCVCWSRRWRRRRRYRPCDDLARCPRQPQSRPAACKRRQRSNAAAA